MLGRNREFFVAHRVSPLDLFLFVAVVSLALPALLVLLVGLVTRLSPLSGRVLHLGVVALLVGAIASEALRKSAHWPTSPHIAAAVGAGALFAWLYDRQTLARTFLTVLGPSVVIFPAIFILQPPMAPFLHPQDSTRAAAATLGASRPPLVVVVFDQLPLTSLMSDTDGLDPQYPGFAALAAQATWYRNATTAAEITGWAIPPILTGLRPSPKALPSSQDYPNNLFTLLGNGYHYEVKEPITDFCPDRLCDADLDPWSTRLATTSLDAGVVFLHLLLPGEFERALPPLTQDWKLFIRNQHWLQRWASERDADRREGPHDFIAGIAATDPRPTLYYLHVLLPHAPFIYLRSGQQFSDGSLDGLLAHSIWVDEEWPVVQSYRRHLLQLRYVDALVGALVARLKSESLWDKALVVVTADHGVSFRPGRPFTGIDAGTLVDLMSVPLFVKLPGQYAPSVSDRNVQSIDIVPTIADVLDIDLPWKADGHSALSDSLPSSAKRIQHTGATKAIDIDTADLARLRHEAVHRRVTIFGEEPDLVPEMSAHRELIGQTVESIGLIDRNGATAHLYGARRFLAFDPEAPLVLTNLRGSIADHGAPVDRPLAIAVNGIVRATTRTYTFSDAAQGSWSAFVHPRHFRKGANDVRVYVIDDSGGRVMLDEAPLSDSGRARSPDSSQ